VPEYNFLELRCKKKNEGDIPDPVYFDFAFYANHDITVTRPEPPAISHGDRFASIIRGFGTRLSVKQIVDSYREEYNDEVSQDVARATLNKDDRFTTVKEGGKTWWTTRDLQASEA
jgi:hypothetical protein